METHKRIHKIIELILILGSNCQLTKKGIVERLDISLSSVERYLNTIRDLGFKISNNHKYYTIDRECSYLKQLIADALPTANNYDLLNKNFEELGIEEREEIIQSIKNYKPLTKFLFLYHNNLQQNFTDINYAIVTRKKIQLKDYKSSNSNTIKDRLVEPFRFLADYKSVWCFDIETRTNKVFKISRI